ncbi:hypothetical protein KBZ12_09430 [Cyanobium sp. Cruz CV13-4-11]|uniref:DUF7734 family protein n=1 Tax=unclassified Cyanobium TaxID=2627006 RepID=UPI0020CCD0EB|nr:MULTISPECIES: hypothetical protein [unclassified Cyanobium]MCP9900580.1 hypothetical protein [Cyanobium sp. Cruz CV11-17]MCP9919701.1 hypothetical protein [Cyanobium sp. Cruz CV13-4-11]
MTDTTPDAASPSVAALLAALEEISRQRPDRVLRLVGTLPLPEPGEDEPFELLIFRGFSSSVTHPTAFDPDQPALPASARIAAAELLAGPLNPSDERRLAGPLPAETFLDPGAWEGTAGG